LVKRGLIEVVGDLELVATVPQTLEERGEGTPGSGWPATPADRGPWGAPEYVTVASIRGHPDRLPVDEDVVEGIFPTVVVGPFRCDLWPICHSKP
jgi:hypothetical protein